MATPDFTTGEEEIPSRETVRQVLENELLDKVRQTPVDLGVALGEFRETANFVASAMVKTVGVMKAARKGDLSGVVQTIIGRQSKATRGRVLKGHKGGNGPETSSFLDRVNPVIKGDTSRFRSVPLSAAGTTLMANYALQPLISDVKGSLEALEADWLTNKRTKYYSKKGRDYSIDLRTEVKPPDSAYPILYGCSGKAKYRARIGIELEIENDLIVALDTLGLLNPISTGYELIPFSFVLDWFLPVGDFLRQMQPPQGYKFVDGYYTERVESQLVDYTTITPPYPSKSWITRSTQTEFYKQREKLTEIPVFTFIVPSVSLSRRKIENGVSLITQFISELGDEGRKPQGPLKRTDYDSLRHLGMSRSEFRAAARKYR